MILLATHLAFGDTLDAQVMTNSAGATMRWATMPVEFKVDPTNSLSLDESGVVSAVVSAGGQWSGAAGAAISSRFRGAKVGLEAGYDDVNVVMFRDVWEWSPDLLAVTQTWSRQDGEIVDFDMMINAEDHAWTLDGQSDATDLWNTVSHEFGHALGIGHNGEDHAATMYPVAVDGETMKRDLDVSDQQIAAFLYPGGDGADADGAMAADRPGCNVLSAEIPQSSFFIGAIAALSLVSRRRKEA